MLIWLQSCTTVPYSKIFSYSLGWLFWTVLHSLLLVLGLFLLIALHIYFLIDRITPCMCSLFLCPNSKITNFLEFQYFWLGHKFKGLWNDCIIAYHACCVHSYIMLLKCWCTFFCWSKYVDYYLFFCNSCTDLSTFLIAVWYMQMWF